MYDQETLDDMIRKDGNAGKSCIRQTDHELVTNQNNYKKGKIPLEEKITKKTSARKR